MLEAEAWDQKTRRRAYGLQQPGMGPEGQPLYKISCYGEFSLLIANPNTDSGEEIVSNHSRLVARAEELSEVLNEPLGQLRELAPELSYNLETLILKRMVPGRCQLCP